MIPCSRRSNAITYPSKCDRLRSILISRSEDNGISRSDCKPGIGKENSFFEDSLEDMPMSKLIIIANNIFFFSSFGIVPFYKYDTVETTLHLYDKKLTLIKKSESETKVSSLSAIWMIFISNWRDYDKKAYESNISRFLKESVDEIKK